MAERSAAPVAGAIADRVALSRMRWGAAAVCALAALAWQGPAKAAPMTYTWTMTGYQNSSTPGNELQFTASEDGSQILKVRSYSSDNDSDDLIDAATTLYSGGVGVTNQSESGGYPNHAIDNSGTDDLVLFEFGADDFNALSFAIGWRSNDSDVRIWVGGSGAGLDLASDAACGGACSIDDLTGTLGFTELSEFSNVAVNTPVDLDTSLTGRYMIVAPGNESRKDYFKVKTIVAELSETSDPPEVAEPNSLGLIAVGLAGLAYVRRKRDA